MDHMLSIFKYLKISLDTRTKLVTSYTKNVLALSNNLTKIQLISVSNKYFYEFLLLALGASIIFISATSNNFGAVSDVFGDLSFTFLIAMKLLPQFQQLNGHVSSIQSAKKPPLIC